MAGNAKETIYASVKKDLAGNIAKLADNYQTRNCNVQNHVKMELAFRTTHANVILVGTESYVAKISHGLRG